MPEQSDFANDISKEDQGLAKTIESLSNREMEELAQKIFEIFLYELIVENERTGRV